LALALARNLQAAETVNDVKVAVQQALAHLSDEPQPASAPTYREQIRDYVGVWRPDPDGAKGSFIRDPRLGDPWMWANIERIEPKSARKRVVLLGESVARGALHDPLFNCASALQSYLDSVEPGFAEVLDLARNGILYKRLLQTLSSVHLLEPDLVVVFAGNNWFAEADKLDFGKMSAILATTRDWHAVAGYIKDTFRSIVRQRMHGLGEAAREHGAQVLFVIPAHNLRDACFPPTWQSPLLSADERRRRDGALAEAERAYAARNYPEAKRLATVVVGIDPGGSGRALQLAGLSALGMGETDEAHRLFRKMLEARLCAPWSGTLMGVADRDEVMRESVIAENMAVVDLPAVFTAFNDGIPPGRELFLDPFHMTALGIRVAMAAVVERALPLLGRDTVAQAQLQRVPISIDPRAAAQAHFTAALLNAKGATDEGLLAYHCREAVRSHPEIAGIVQAFVRFSVPGPASTFYGAFEHVINSSREYPNLRRVLYGGAGSSSRVVDVALIRAMCDAVTPVYPDIQREFESLLTEYTQRNNSGSVDLLPHAVIGMAGTGWDPVLAREPTWRRERGRSYLRALAARTEFQLMCDGSRRLGFDIVVRLGDRHAEPGTALIEVNGTVVHDWHVEHRWTSTRCDVPESLVRPGANAIVIAWPEQQYTSDDRAEAMLDVLRGGAVDGVGVLREAFPIYGEVFSFVVTVSTVASSVGSPSFA
jgi:hypothetical protein